MTHSESKVFKICYHLRTYKDG